MTFFRLVRCVRAGRDDRSGYLGGLLALPLRSRVALFRRPLDEVVRVGRRGDDVAAVHGDLRRGGSALVGARRSGRKEGANSMPAPMPLAPKKSSTTRCCS